jgi:Family of unknown function (DUF6390)
MTAGPLLFARYAYAPNALGYCGADEPRTLLEYGDAKASDGGLAELARSFEGAWPYLQLIASANHIDDPLDPRVVDAYWVGNRLLDGVAPDHLARHVEDRFRGRIGRGWQDVLDAVAAGGVPHHSFHVFVVYPWLGLMRTGIVDEPLRVLDQCRTTPALVRSVDGDRADVLAPLLVWSGRELTLGPWGPREVHWRADGLAFADALRPGEWVALHWDFVCERLTSTRAQRLLHATRRGLEAVNRRAAGGLPTQVR